MTTWILAQQTMEEKIAILRQMGSRFEDPDPHLWWKIPSVLCLFVAAILLVWMLYTVQRRRQEREVAPQPRRLFLRAMREIGLSASDVWHLWRLAGRTRIHHPTAMLISARYFDQVVAQDCCDQKGQLVHAARRRRLMAIRPAIFGPEAPAP